MTAPRAITVDLPLPARELHQNFRSDRSRMATWRAEQAARMAARLAGFQAARGIEEQWTRCAATFTFRFPDKRRRDLSNALAACKAYQDGIVDGACAVIADDSLITEIHATATVDRTNPGVRIVITKAEGG